MTEYKKFVLNIADIIEYVKRLTEEQYQRWRKEALDLADQSSFEDAGRVLEIIDDYRKREINVCS